MDAQKGGGIGQRTWRDASGTWQFAYQYLPGGETISLATGADAKDAWVTSIGDHHPVVRAANKTALYWLPGASEPDVDPRLPAGSEVWSARLAPSGYATDYRFIVEWAASSGQRYLGLMKERTDGPSDILGMTDLQLQRGGVWMTANLLVGNTTLPAEALSRYGTFEGFPSGVPIVLDLANAQAHPIDPLMTRYAKGDRTRILAAVPGPWLKVTGAGDCLYVRTLPKVGQYTGCFKDGVLLRDRGETRSVDGTTWIAVSAPGVAEGWASADYLDTTGRDMTVPPLSHPKGTRTGNSAIDPVLEAIESGDPAKQLAVVRFTAVPCMTNPRGLGAPPTCAAGETEGTPIEVLPQSCSEGSYVRKTAIDTSIPLFSPDLPLYAVVSQQHPSSAARPMGSYAIIYRSMAMEGMSISVAVDAGRIVNILSCQPRPQDILKDVPLADIILLPPK